MVQASPPREEQFVGFRLAGETYGIPITLVHEIIRARDIVRVPGSPAHIRGVINLRGSIVPVLDLRNRLGLEPADESPALRIVVVDADPGTVGLMVDNVTQVLRIPADQIEPVARVGADLETEMIDGIGKLDDDLVILLNVPRALRADI